MNDLEIKKTLGYVGENVIISKNIRIRHPEKVFIEKDCIIDDFCYVSGSLKLGQGVHIGASCTFQAGKSNIIIDSYTGISSGCRLFGVSSNYLASEIDLPTLNLKSYNSSTIHGDIHIGEACLIGANSIIMPGVNIPSGVSFGMLSKITNKAYRPFSFYSGDCKKVLYKRNEEKINSLLNILKNG